MLSPLSLARGFHSPLPYIHLDPSSSHSHGSFLGNRAFWQGLMQGCWFMSARPLVDQRAAMMLGTLAVGSYVAFVPL
jgi:hypothetical protein